MNTYEIAKKENLVPVGLINKKAIVKKHIKKGEFISYDMIDLDTSTLIYQLRKKQDEMD